LNRSTSATTSATGSPVAEARSSSSVLRATSDVRLPVPVSASVAAARRWSMLAQRIAVDSSVTLSSMDSGRIRVGGLASAAPVTNPTSAMSSAEKIASAVTRRPGKPPADGTIDATSRNRSPTPARPLMTIATAIAACRSSTAGKIGRTSAVLVTEPMATPIAIEPTTIGRNASGLAHGMIAAAVARLITPLMRVIGSSR
jgi:hypothetical protein